VSLLFNNVNDVVASDATLTLGETLSVFAWINPTSAGEGGGGYIMSQRDGATPRLSLGISGTNRLTLRIDRTSTPAIWTTADDTLVLSTWQHAGFVITTFTTDANDPTFYINGAVSALSTDTNGSGTELSDNATVRIGNNSVLTRTFDGLIGEAAIWTRVLTAAEAAAVYMLGVLAVPDGLFLYWPMDNTGTAHATDLSGNGRGGTVTGAAVGANPPTRPAGRKG
jgi:hypothetical protein